MSSQPIKGAYYRGGISSITPAQIETQYFTHIFYAFLNPNETSFKFNISAEEKQRLLEFTTVLRGKNPPVKTLFAVGGASVENTQILSSMASDAETRAAFIRSTIRVARKYGFDGVDLDWEFPRNHKQMNDLGSLLQEWRVKIENEARRNNRTPLLLTAAVYFNEIIDWDFPDLKFPAASMRDNLDFINVMTYDYYVSRKNMTGAHAALRGDDKSTKNGLLSWIGTVVPRSKLIMGMPLYGRRWTLQSPEQSGIGAPAVDLDVGDTSLAYSEVVELNIRRNVQPTRHQGTRSVYSVWGTDWISHDDAWSVGQKIEYARTQRLGGYFFWAVDFDYHWSLSSEASSLWQPGPPNLMNLCGELLTCLCRRSDSDSDSEPEQENDRLIG